MRLECLSCCLMVFVVAGVTRAEPERPEVLDQRQGPIKVIDYNGGGLAHRYLADRGGGQDVALWIAAETDVVRGVLLSLHQGSEAYRTDLQQLARTLDFAVYGSLIRWDGFEHVLPDQLGQLGEELGHPEVVNVPWVGLGVSRNVGALLNFARAGEKDRMLGYLFAGGPGAAIRLNDPEDVERFSTIPMLTVNGSADPFVDKMNWQHKVYPRIRAKDLPYTVAVDWGEGHAFKQGLVLATPFIQAVYDHRVPDDADPTQGPVELKPMGYEDGWLVGPVDWEGRFGPNVGRVGEYEGDPQQAVWAPDERTARLWHHFHTRAGAHVATDDRGQPTAGEGAALSRATINDRASVVWTTDADAEETIARPALVVDGEVVDIEAGHRAGHKADTPAAAIRLNDEDRATLQTLIARAEADVPSKWRVIFRDDFEPDLKDAWYEYYQRTAERKDREMQRETSMKVVDGAMQLSGNLHVAAMLPYDWPDDVAVEYRTRPISEKVSDLSVVLSGNPSGSAFPWRAGMMFQFGAHFNQGSFFLVHEQPHENWQAHDTGARISRGWQTIRVERLDGVATAYLDGEKIAERRITDHEFERFFGRKIGLYTFGSTAQFDDVKIAIREPTEPEAIEPALPGSAAMASLAQALAEKLADPFAKQRWAADRLIQKHSRTLLPVMQQLIETDRITDESIRQKLQKRIDAMPPMSL